MHSPAARKAVLASGSDDGGKIWLNRRLVTGVSGARSAAPGQDKVDVELKAGWNEVLVKIHQSHGGWGFYFELLDPDGRSWPDLSYACPAP